MRENIHPNYVKSAVKCACGNAFAPLFEVPTDLGEAKDLAAEHPQRVAQLAALLDAWEEGLVEPLFGATLEK